MEDYSGIYGAGHKDSSGNLYLDLYYFEGILVREKTDKNTYDVGIIIDDDKNSHFSIAEDISLREWRKLFLELTSESGAKKLENLVINCIAEKWFGC